MIGYYLALGYDDDKLPVVDFGMDAVKHCVLGQPPCALDAAARPLHHKILRMSTPLISLDQKMLLWILHYIWLPLNSQQISAFDIESCRRVNVKYSRSLQNDRIRG